ncbi:MAG: DUF72 domain-containing protein [Deltaproteobacteria bacterium]|nr:DUF72 domain-containing protein [Deltaproteobacteria bacterium]
MDARVRALLDKNIYLGTSSWKYPGWKGIVYRGDYPSEKQFNETCLKEYSEHYPTVGVDHTYYAWPGQAGIQKYMSLTPDFFRFGFKVTEKVTVLKYPKLPRYGKDAGTINEQFLDHGLFREKFLEPLSGCKQKLGPILFEFSQFHTGTIVSGTEFVQRLDSFFSALGVSNDYVFAVEIRNANWLKPAYFQMLAKHRIAHVHNSWTRMPSIAEQLEVSRDFDLPTAVSRILLSPGTQYQQAVEAFSPYSRVLSLQVQVRNDAALLIKRAIHMGVPAYVFVNNRCEGCAPQTIQGILNFV